MFSIIIIDAIFFALCFYTNSIGLEKISDLSLILVFIITFLGFIYSFHRLYNVRCPSCSKKTKTIKNKEIDQWQAHCSACNIRWDLGIGTDTGP